ncbi:MAG: glutamate formimidoyltransferase [Gemmatimonadetes bacterium]|nr:glutamate formimidoyltransferase [Gemmatimonadota bacterium]MDA1104614.1 glutamate formimidoyltransferase [Gemmatimonadota bacterium]
MIKVLEAVPNFSEGRDLAMVGALVDRIASFDVEVLDWSADPDHHRSVVTYIGDPKDVEAASVAGARFAMEHIDLRGHAGVHPRVGALDVMPFVPLHGLTMSEAVASAKRVGEGIAALGVPVFFYGNASSPAGRGLAELRRGGVEALRDGWPAARRPDLPLSSLRPHPTAGATCVGARPILLAWNVFVTDIDEVKARDIASRIRERGGGFSGLRALGLRLKGQNRVQISMNLEDPQRTSPLVVFEAIESEVHAAGGAIVETQVIGMIPDALVHPKTADRLMLPDLGPARVLSHRVAEYVSSRRGGVHGDLGHH